MFHEGGSCSLMENHRPRGCVRCSLGARDQLRAPAEDTQRSHMILVAAGLVHALTRARVRALGQALRPGPPAVEGFVSALTRECSPFGRVSNERKRALSAALARSPQGARDKGCIPAATVRRSFLLTRSVRRRFTHRC